MSEFGHIAARYGSFHVDAWGAGNFVLTVDGKTHLFEDSDRFGPSKLNKNGAIAAYPHWPERHRFWIAHRQWVKQGRRLQTDGRTCIWDEPTPSVIFRIARGFTVSLVQGDEDGPTYWAGTPEGNAVLAAPLPTAEAGR